MRKIAKILAMSLTLTIIMIFSIAGTVFAADGNSGKGKGNMGEVCPYGEGVCEECEPNNYAWDWNYEGPGPHGAQHGKVTE